MNAQDSTLLLIKKSEGCLLRAYQDAAGIWTIGWGTVFLPDGSKIAPGMTITQQQADDYLLIAVNKRVAIVNEFLGDTALNQNQFDALVDFTYNVGSAAFTGSSLARAIKANPADPSIRDHFMQWNKIHQNGVLGISKDLTARRQAEADLYFS